MVHYGLLTKNKTEVTISLGDSPQPFSCNNTETNIYTRTRVHTPHKPSYTLSLCSMDGLVLKNHQHSV